MSQLIESLRRRNTNLQAECDALAGAIDQMSNTQATLISRLQVHDPEFIRQLTGEPTPEAPSAEAAAEPSTEVATLQ